MTEQKRGKETPVQFPRVPDKIWMRVVEKTNKEKSKWGKNNSITLINETEPGLAGFIGTLSQHMPSRNEFIAGALWSWLVFENLRKEGYKLPRVSEDTTLAYQGDLVTSGEGWEPSVGGSINAFLGFVLQGREGLNPDDFTLSSPAEFKDENPLLMRLFDNSLTTYMRLGALIVYDLKRRQFHADQLAKQFGG